MPSQTVVRKLSGAGVRGVRNRLRKKRTSGPNGLTPHEFLRLSLPERRKILRVQALAARSYYAESKEWREWEAADLRSGKDE